MLSTLLSPLLCPLMAPLVAPLAAVALHTAPAPDLFASATAAQPAARSAEALDVFRLHPELARAELDSLWALVTDELQSLRLLEVEPLMLALHERYLAAWTAVNLGLLWQKLGRYSDVDALFQESIARERSQGHATGGLVNQWGILLLGAGDVRRALTLLERASALGSDDAVCVLGRLELVQDRPRKALRRVRALMLSDEPPAWAQRTWGLALLTP